MTKEVLLSNEIKVKIISFFNLNDSFVAYPGFNTIRGLSSDNEPCGPKFISGVGLITDRGDTGFYENELIAFCGYCMGDISEEIIISVNSVVKINSKEKLYMYSMVGYIAKLISTVNSLAPKLGEKVLLIIDDKEEVIYMALLEQFGCKPVSYNKLLDESESSYHQVIIKDIDSCIIAKNCDKKNNKLLSSLHPEVVVALTRKEIDIDFSILNKIILEDGLGQGYFDFDYMMGNTIYPDAYVKQSVQTNMQLAIDFIEKNVSLIIKIANTLNMFYNNTFNERTNPVNRGENKKLAGKILFDEKGINQILEILNSRLNPYLLQLTLQNMNESSYKDALNVINRIIGLNFMKLVTKNENKVAQIYNFRVSDGSLVIINLVKSNNMQNELECHVDNNTLLLNEKGLEIYT